MSEILSAEAKTRSWPALVLVATCCALPFITVLTVAHFDLEDVQFGFFNLGGIVLLAVVGALMVALRKMFPGVSCCGLYRPVATTGAGEARSLSPAARDHNLPLGTMKRTAVKGDEAAEQGAARAS